MEEELEINEGFEVTKLSRLYCRLVLQLLSCCFEMAKVKDISWAWHRTMVVHSPCI